MFTFNRKPTAAAVTYNTQGANEGAYFNFLGALKNNLNH